MSASPSDHSVLGIDDEGDMRQVVRTLADQVKDLGAQAESARREADELRATLERESRRLEKLWEVYAAQEGELEEARAELARLERRVQELSDGGAVGRVEADLRTERERLAKLYAAYEELDAQKSA